MKGKGLECQVCEWCNAGNYSDAGLSVRRATDLREHRLHFHLRLSRSLEALCAKAVPLGIFCSWRTVGSRETALYGRGAPGTSQFSTACTSAAGVVLDADMSNMNMIRLNFFTTASLEKARLCIAPKENGTTSDGRGSSALADCKCPQGHWSF